MRAPIEYEIGNPPVDKIAVINTPIPQLMEINP